MKISIIVALDRNNLIGKNNSLPWHLPADLKHFKETTMGHHILFGQKTFESIGHPLKGRTNIILSNDPNYFAKECITVRTPIEAIKYAKERGENELFICGGAMVYKTFLSLSDRIYMTKIDHSFNGDTYFPKINLNSWKLVSKEDHKPDVRNPYFYHFLIYDKK